jgi:hypothetical protein
MAAANYGLQAASGASTSPSGGYSIGGTFRAYGGFNTNNGVDAYAKLDLTTYDQTGTVRGLNATGETIKPLNSTVYGVDSRAVSTLSTGTTLFAKGVSGVVTGSGNIGTASGLYGEIAFGPIYTTANAIYGLVAANTSATSAYGLRGVVDGLGTKTFAYGCSGRVLSGTNRYGVHGEVPSASGFTFQAALFGTAPTNGTLNQQNGTWSSTSSWAVWSQGAQFSSTHALWSTSDARLKENIQPLTGSLDAILKLAPKTYSYKTKLHPSFNLPDGMQMGLISQEVEKVLPTLVMDTRSPDQFDEAGKIVEPGFEFKVMSYTGLIPVLVGAIQDQQVVIAEKQDQIDLLSERLSALERRISMAGTSGAVRNAEGHLEQNSPNPFNENTVIRFFVPEGSSKASIQVSGIDGKSWKSFDSLWAGQGQLVISAGSLPAGEYVYTLYVDGGKVDSKAMVITR